MNSATASEYETGKALRDQVKAALEAAGLGTSGVRWYGKAVVTVETFDPDDAARVTWALGPLGLALTGDRSRTAVYVEPAGTDTEVW